MKKLCRSRDNKVLAGVCSGIAEYLGMDVTVVRVLIAVASVVSFGTAIIAYLLCALLIPEESDIIDVDDDK